MTIDAPSQIQPLRRLWKQAFGDPDAFLDHFFSTGFSPDRCRCLTQNGQLVAALYWFDCSLDGAPFAYLYAVATDTAYRNQGLCRTLMDHTHRHLKELGYQGVLLVPGSQTLFHMYEKMGYQVCGYIREFTCQAAAPISLHPIGMDKYAALRQRYLPVGGVTQTGPLLAFLHTQVSFYEGENFVLCAAKEGSTLTVPELLGNESAASGIVGALGAATGRFRVPGNDRPFAMYRALCPDAPVPSYFALALD